VIVWLWDASIPARSGRGVTDDETRARQAAEAWMCSGNAGGVRVEKAFTVLGNATLTVGYERTGEGWAAQRDPGGRITWTPFTMPLPEPAPS
jgi:hypothetical protein